MRRIYDPNQYDFLQPLQPMNTFITWMAFALIASQLFFVINYLWSAAKGPKSGGNPWKATTIEWTAAPSPPPHGNFPGGIPKVYRGPYEYSSPDSDEDFLPQDSPPGPLQVPVEPAGIRASDAGDPS